MSQDTETMELRVSTSHITQASDSIVVRAEVPSGKRENSAGKYITCIASEEMKITGSGELNHTPNTNKRVSWSKLRDGAQSEANLSHKENNTTDAENKDENQMELESLKEETTSNKLENNEGGVDMEKQKEVEMMDTNEVVHVYGRVDTPPLSSRSSISTTMRDGSKGSGIIIHKNNNNLRQSGVELEDIVLEAREGIGNNNRMSRKALRNSVILHAPPQPPSSPPHLPLKVMKVEEDISLDKSINSEDDTEEEEEIKKEGEERLAMESMYADIEAYGAANEKGHIIEVKEGEMEIEGVGMGIAKPKQDRLVRKEIVRIIIVALIAVVVVIVFVFT